jgi:hypothetical protein
MPCGTTRAVTDNTDSEESIGGGGVEREGENKENIKYEYEKNRFIVKKVTRKIP